MMPAKACARSGSRAHCSDNSVPGRVACRRIISTGLHSLRRKSVVTQAQQAALITGSSSGIGQGVALNLAVRGWTVFAGVRTQADAQGVQQLHSNIQPVIIDVTSESSIAAAQQAVQQQLGSSGLSLLVNNAGVGLVAPAEFVPLNQWRQVLDVNLQGPLAVTQAFLPLLRQSEPQKARIINISSVAGHLALPFWSAYNVSKAGLDVLSECLRYELADQGISVVCLKPGPVVTPIWDKSRQKSQDVVAGMPAAVQQLYGPTYDKMSEMVAKTEETAIPVSEVVNVIVEAATTAQPKPVYLVGKDAGLSYWLKRLLPDEAWASILTKTLSSKQ